MAKSSKKTVKTTKSGKASKGAKVTKVARTEILFANQHSFMSAETFSRGGRDNQVLVFNNGPGDDYPFSFGANNAARLLAAIGSYGYEHVVAELKRVAGDKITPEGKLV